ncbi:MAG: hypothetical protein KDA22_14195 [Phycisphaerales bacterium]|nr:hypothetical protein [Phycisphaerales bacterium]
MVKATVLLSIVAHGFSAMPGIRWYAASVAKLPPNAPEREGEQAPAEAAETEQAPHGRAT